MDDTLKASFSDNEREHAATLFDGESPDLRVAITSLFADLNDPLLAAQDVTALLGADGKQTEVTAILDELTGEGALEVSTKTQRPFDQEGVRLYRRTISDSKVLRLLALESLDDSDRHRFLFTIDGRLIRSFARVARLNAIDSEGNQREEIKKHVRNIAEGIRAGTRIPNPVLLVILEEATAIIEADEDDDSIPQSFVKIRPYADISDWIEVEHSDERVQMVRLAVLEIPFRRAAFDDEKSILLVDGQQRTAALSLVPVDEISAIEMAATAVVADAEEAKRIFQIANNTVKISTDFSSALLASMDEPPTYLKTEKIKADACKILALTDQDSPFYLKVKHAGAKVQAPPIVYNSLFAVVSAFAEALPDSMVGTPQDLASLVSRCFVEIRSVWPDAWEMKSAESRLVHGAGLRAMAALAVSKISGYLEAERDLDDEATWDTFRDSMQRLRTKVVWTDAEAAGAGNQSVKKTYRNEIASRQNTATDIKSLTDFLRKESLDLDMKAGKNAKGKAVRNA